MPFSSRPSSSASSSSLSLSRCFSPDRLESGFRRDHRITRGTGDGVYIVRYWGLGARRCLLSGSVHFPPTRCEVKMSAGPDLLDQRRRVAPRVRAPVGLDVKIFRRKLPWHRHDENLGPVYHAVLRCSRACQCLVAWWLGIRL